MRFTKGRLSLRNGNWGLKLLSLVLAIIVYYAIKTESARGGRSRFAAPDAAVSHDGTIPNDGTTDKNP